MRSMTQHGVGRGQALTPAQPPGASLHLLYLGILPGLVQCRCLDFSLLSTRATRAFCMLLTVMHRSLVLFAPSPWHCKQHSPCLQTNTLLWKSVRFPEVTAARTSRNVVLRISLASASVKSLGKQWRSQAVAPGCRGSAQRPGELGFAPHAALGTKGACSAHPMEKRHLPILGVLKPEPVAVAQAHKLVQDDGTEEGALSLQHASGEHLQPGRVVGIQVSNVLQDLARNPHHTHVNRGDFVRASQSPGKPQKEQGKCTCQASRLWAGRLLSPMQP